MIQLFDLKIFIMSLKLALVLILPAFIRTCLTLFQPESILRHGPAFCTDINEFKPYFVLKFF
ncbi:hypothetical protein ACM44_01570 [Chryseobacterium koreense CCUG 49689]|uniref:Uncharacterized protein n=1 Tax=Chryseobacterium koreense CCUG 49689 TaxID=1304281 RepID=A0A0J7J344_9FLAO|nr:hypothetical protein ACM44_01570 [Chryseobacterium koreense CCUG 49689]MBB5333453.1 hypothetical protein [Chryseobacterium koreense]